MKNSEKKRPLQIRPKRHYGYSFLVTGEMPQHRAYLLRYLTECRMGLIDDLGGPESMTTGQLIIVDRVISKLGVARLIEEHCRENGVFRDQQLAPPLKESYLAYSNSIRLDLQSLGIEKRVARRILTPMELSDAVDMQNESESERKTGPESPEDA